MSTKALMLAIGLGVFLVAGPANAAVDPASACKESKAKATGKKAFDLMKAFGKNIKKSDSLKLESDISKAESRFTKAFTKAEGKGGCHTSGDSGTIETRVNLEVCRIVDSVGPATCGNNCRGVGEECDGTDADQCITQLCIPAGDPSGDECKCQGCGDGILIAGEQCDEGTANGTPASCCNTDCTLRAASEACTDTDGNVCTVAGCDGASGDCDQGHISTPASTVCPDTDGNVCTIAGCDGAGACDQNHVLPNSDPCADTDGSDCTTAGCDGAGNCDQGHILVPASTPCTSAPDLECANPGCDGAGVCDPLHFLEPSSVVCGDTDGNVCTTAGCDGAGACDQNHIFAPPSEPCPDTDGNVCTTAGCDGLGACNQSHIFAPDSTVCPDTDGNVCTVAGCNALGACDQLHILPSGTACGNPANTECTNPDTCDGAGNCLANHEASSTPCTDTDGNVCTIAGCNGLGVCNQGHILPASDPCPDTDGNDCTIAGCNGAGVCDQGHVPVPESTPCTSAPDLECANRGCDGAGVCDPLHFPEPFSMPCTDTDGDVCSTAGCNGLGVCDQLHIVEPPSEPCPDTDGNVCTTAGCDGLGACNQSHILAPDSTTCPDTDGNVCTVAGCNALGACDQLHILPSGTACGNPANTDCTDPDTCDGAGNCLANHEPSSTTCTDTDGNVCTIAGCDGLGVCNQSHVFAPSSDPCPDTDGNECTVAGCNGIGICDQLHILEPPSTLCGGGAGSCSTEHCDGAGTCVNESDCCAGLNCSEGECDLLSFETGIPTGLGGVLQNFRCSGGDAQFEDVACNPDIGDPDCYFGPCYIGPNFCAGNYAIGCTSNADCQGTCGEVSTGNLPLDLEKGGLYTGGGLNSVPLPFPVPDQGLSYTSVTDCNPSTGELTLGPTTPVEVGKYHCTQGRTCTGGTNNGLHCVLLADCPGGGTCTDNCVFGPPLPIPNAGTPATSVCAVNVVDEDAGGAAECDGGDSDLSTPLRSVIYLNGDLLSSSNLPDLPGVQPCPLCVRICNGGSEDGLPCRPDNPNRSCAAGTRVGRACTDNSDCPNPPNPDATCLPARTEYSDCIDGGGTCGLDSECLGGQNDGASCTPATSTSDLLGDPQDSYPTSHDCLMDSLQNITANIGGLPINFALTTGEIIWDAEDRPNGARVFCGFCRDVTGGGSLCFEGSLAGGCPASIPAATGNAVPCTSDADCVDADTYESCVQRDPGAFSEAMATRITVTGAPPAPPNDCLGDGGLHETELVSLFCVPPTFDATVDAAGDLPGPGAALMAGDAQLD